MKNPIPSDKKKEVSEEPRRKFKKHERAPGKTLISLNKSRSGYSGKPGKTKDLPVTVSAHFLVHFSLFVGYLSVYAGDRTDLRKRIEKKYITL